MLRSAVETQLRERFERDGYLRPDYENYCIGNVPDTIRSVLDAGGSRSLPGDVFEGVDTDVERVVLVLVDGYGLDSWKRDRPRHGFLDRLTERATVTPLTSVYPSETAAAITTLETGQLPCEHGRIGWNVYEPASDRSFLSLTGAVKHDPGDEESAPEAGAGVEYLYEAMGDRGSIATACSHSRVQFRARPGTTTTASRPSDRGSARWSRQPTRQATSTRTSHRSTPSPTTTGPKASSSRRR